MSLCGYVVLNNNLLFFLNVCLLCNIFFIIEQYVCSCCTIINSESLIYFRKFLVFHFMFIVRGRERDHFVRYSIPIVVLRLFVVINVSWEIEVQET